MLKHILVAVDGSPGARKALTFAVGLARSTGAKLTLLAVLELPAMLPFAPMESFAVTPTVSEEHLAAVRRLLKEAASGVDAARVEELVEMGRPAEVICEQAEKLGAELIVMGARGQGTATRWWVGSVSDRVVHMARLPVTVVP